MISIHAPRGGSDFLVGIYLPACRYISIHAPRGGSDLTAYYFSGHRLISIHAPRGGSDLFYAII